MEHVVLDFCLRVGWVIARMGRGRNRRGMGRVRCGGRRSGRGKKVSK
jgi:hypothetical protein